MRARAPTSGVKVATVYDAVAICVSDDDLHYADSFGRERETHADGGIGRATGSALGSRNRRGARRRGDRWVAVRRASDERTHHRDARPEWLGRRDRRRLRTGHALARAAARSERLARERRDARRTHRARRRYAFARLETDSSARRERRQLLSVD